MAILRNQTVFDFNGVSVKVEFKTGGELDLQAKAADGWAGHVFIENEFAANMTEGNIILSNDPTARQSQLDTYEEIRANCLKGARYPFTHKNAYSNANDIQAGTTYRGLYGSIRALRITGDAAAEKEAFIMIGFGSIDPEDVGIG